MRWLLVPLLLAVAPRAWADAVPDDLRRAYETVAAEADRLAAQTGPAAAIAHYEQALLADLAGYGRVHLRLGQLHQKAGRAAPAAFHFAECDADERVELINRELVCQDGLKASTAPVTLDGLPVGGRVIILEPALFAGELRSGQRLPLGALKLVAEAPGHPPRTSSLVVQGPLRWTVQLSAVAAVLPAAPESSQPVEIKAKTVEEPAGTWPAWVAGGTGLALVGAGLSLGLNNQGELDTLRRKQEAGRCVACEEDLRSARGTAQVADGLWIGGAVVVAGAAALWWLLAEDGE